MTKRKMSNYLAGEGGGCIRFLWQHAVVVRFKSDQCVIGRVAGVLLFALGRTMVRWRWFLVLCAVLTGADSSARRYGSHSSTLHLYESDALRGPRLVDRLPADDDFGFESSPRVRRDAPSPSNITAKV